jgi:hypothetical protein
VLVSPTPSIILPGIYLKNVVQFNRVFSIENVGEIGFTLWVGIDYYGCRIEWPVFSFLVWG